MGGFAVVGVMGVVAWSRARVRHLFDACRGAVGWALLDFHFHRSVYEKKMHVIEHDGERLPSMCM
jgi:hypothetical protein